jgi:uncharacterized protein YybS (DUF2232 family)
VSKGTYKELLSGVAFTLMLITLSVYLPIIGWISSLLIPLPVLVCRLRLGKYPGTVLPVIVFLITWSVMGRFSATLLFFGELLLLGFVLGEVLSRKASIEKAFLHTGSVVLMTTLAMMLLASRSSGQSLVAFISVHVAQNLEMSLKLYEQQGISADSLLVIENSIDKIQYILVRILPGLMTSGILLTIWFNILAARSLSRKFRFYFPDYGTLNHWKISDSLVWAVIGCSLMLLLPSQGLNLTGANGLIAAMTIYFFQGIAIVSFYLEKKKSPPIIKSLCYGFIFLQQIFMLLVIALGFFDTWLNFRKLEFHHNY